MSRRARTIGLWMLLLTVALVAGPATGKPVSAEGPLDPARAWRRYLQEDAGRKPALKFPYEHCFRRSASAHDLPLALLLAVARGESDFDPNARSRANAHGLMQILWPTTAHHLGLSRISDLYVPCKNVDAGTRYLKELLGRYQGDLHLALAAYNYGPTRIRPGARHIPEGAEWYSAYIYRHLDYVLGGSVGPKDGKGQDSYGDVRKLEIVVFEQPYRARAFVQAVQAAAPGVRLDWFRAGIAQYRVLLVYTGESDLKRSKRLLAKAGFPI